MYTLDCVTNQITLNCKHRLHEKAFSFDKLISHPNKKTYQTRDMVWEQKQRSKRKPKLLWCQAINSKFLLHCSLFNRFLFFSKLYVCVCAHFQIDLRHIMSSIKIISIAKSLHLSIDNLLSFFFCWLKRNFVCFIQSYRNVCIESTAYTEEQMWTLYWQTRYDKLWQEFCLHNVFSKKNQPEEKC